MTAPINNANFTSPITTDPSKGRERAERGEVQSGEVESTEREHRTPAATGADSVQVTARTEPAPDRGINTLDQALQSLARTRQLLTEQPAAAVAAHGNLDPASVAGSLHQAA